MNWRPSWHSLKATNEGVVVEHDYRSAYPAELMKLDCPLCDQSVPSGLVYCGSLCSSFHEASMVKLCRDCMEAYSKEAWEGLPLEGRICVYGRPGVMEHRTCKCGSSLVLALPEAT